MFFLSRLFNSKLSKYNIVAEHQDGTILYNQITGAMILLSASEQMYWKKLKKNNFFVPLSFLSLLDEGGFLIKKSTDELEWMNSVYLKNTEKKNKSLTIAVTDRCNLDCPYCYEHKNHWVSMTDETLEQMEKFSEEFLTTPTDSFSVTWYGGEPTLHIKAIERLHKKFQSLCQKNNIPFYQSMITNGTTLNKEMADRLWKMNILQLQITVDGLKEQHDLSRPVRRSLTVLQEKKSCGDCNSDQSHSYSSYDRIMANIPYLYEKGFTVNMRVNVGSKNTSAYKQLSKIIEEKGWTKRSANKGHVNVYPARLFESENSLSMIEFDKAANWPISIVKPFSGDSCVAGKKFGLCISQNGRISKCWHHTTNEEHLIGDIWNLKLARDGYYDGWSPKNDPNCSNCHVLPTCWGGCRANNEFWEKGYNGEHYSGCGMFKWNTELKVSKLYEKTRDQKRLASV